MFFTRFGRIVAFLALALGILRIGLALSILNEWTGVPSEVALARYSTASSTGELIDKGIYTILFAIALGIATEISYGLRSKA